MIISKMKSTSRNEYLNKCMKLQFEFRKKHKADISLLLKSYKQV